ncbi:MAG TPA: helix-turn-helix domain-containing protein [Puia sp.]|nr:helix-turn-helix domain-containing protein [Puia sp.]
MGDQIQYIHSDIKRACFEEQFFKADVFFDEHILVWLISGETKIVENDRTHLFGAGDTLLFPRNVVAKVFNYPKDGLPHKSVTMHLKTERLQEYYHKNGNAKKPVKAPELKFETFEKHPLLESCLSSLVPYFDLRETLPEAIASLKIVEAIHTVRKIKPEIDQVLGYFADPGKIDLANFMERNFMFNMPMEKFGYLTGRSLTTFKRDFKRVFDTTPQKWLTMKRLEMAHHHIKQKNRKPADVYLETGFENLSHFSYAFKKHFGYPPTHGG